MTAARVLLASLLVLLGPGCGGTTELVGDGGGSLPGLESLEITPGASTVVVDDLAAFQSVALAATGHFAGGETRDVTAEVDWGVDNPLPGDFTGPGAWRSSNAAGGLVGVEARSGDIAATAAITVMFQPVIDDPAYPPPQGVDDLFDPSTPVVTGDATRSPGIVYPADQVMFPTNVYRINFQWNTGTGNDVYRLRFTSTYLDMKVYTTGDRWQADALTWGFLANTNAGAKVAMTVAAVDSADPSTIYESGAIDVHFSRSAVEGAIYYWSTSSEGVMKGVLSEPAPTKFYTQPPSTTCVACHTVSRDGRRMAVGYDGETLQEIDVPARDVIIPAEYEMGWSTFSPDGSRLLYATKGGLRLIDADDGSPVGGADGWIDLGGAQVTHPDWSPQGDHAVMAVCASAGNNKDVEGCSIGRVPYAGGAWGAIEILVPAGAAPDNNFFPRYSPDGKWIVYVNAAGKSKDQPLSELRMIRSDGSSPAPIVLAVANRRVGPLDGVPLTGSTMPTWAPSSHPGTQWIAFSSIRDYGKLLVGDKADQLWVVAIDPDRAALGEDPSYAAFWLPLQDMTERNHRAFWAIDSEQPCPGTTEVCDEFDNDCDGIIDEDCIPCAGTEICFDGIDNDCDGLIDEACVG